MPQPSGCGSTEHRRRMPRWLGVDHGTKRIGLAVGDTADGIVTPLAVLAAEPLAAVIDQIRRTVEQYDAVGVVVGWPINMDDSAGPPARAACGIAFVRGG